MEQKEYETTIHRRLGGIQRLMRKQGKTFEMEQEFHRGGGITSLSIVLLDELAQEFEPILARFLKKRERANRG